MHSPTLYAEKQKQKQKTTQKIKYSEAFYFPNRNAKSKKINKNSIN